MGFKDKGSFSKEISNQDYDARDNKCACESNLNDCWKPLLQRDFDKFADFCGSVQSMRVNFSSWLPQATGPNHLLFVDEEDMLHTEFRVHKRELKVQTKNKIIKMSEFNADDMDVEDEDGEHMA